MVTARDGDADNINLRGRNLSRYSTLNPHLLAYKLRFLRSVPAQLTTTRDGSERSLLVEIDQTNLNCVTYKAWNISHV